MSRLRPSPAMIVASIALFAAIGGSATAATLITSAKIKNNTIKSIDVKNRALQGIDIKVGSLGTQVVGDGTLQKADVAAGQFVGGNLTVQRTDVPLPDGGSADGSTGCPAGTKIIGGSVNISDAGSADVNITVSRPAGEGDSLPDSGQGFDRWRGAAHNPTSGGTAATTLRVWAICTS